MYAQDWATWYPVSGRAFHTDSHAPMWTGAVAHYIGFHYYTEWGQNAFWPECVYISLYSSLRTAQYHHVLKCPSERFKNYWGGACAVSYGWNGGAYGLGANDSFGRYYTGNTREARRRIREGEVKKPATTVMSGDCPEKDGWYEYTTYGIGNATTRGRYHNGGLNANWCDGHVSWQQDLTAADFDRNL